MHDGGSEVSISFESGNAPYLVVVGNERQYSLSLEFAEVPTGRDAALGPSGRQSCISHETSSN
ncbi:MbtH family NRPS accessory protein [Streptomyces lydicus]|uniref:MbtH family NRPS accessory protein n=1 Tax=Streptomyces lydicus TaxID=47763 RepID=UPI001F509F8F|nr:MbtH family NRPS accessory protein [Streptomyces lydicus]